MPDTSASEQQPKAFTVSVNTPAPVNTPDRQRALDAGRQLPLDAPVVKRWRRLMNEQEAQPVSSDGPLNDLLHREPAAKAENP